jgi:hypothetical protein
MSARTEFERPDCATGAGKSHSHREVPTGESPLQSAVGGNSPPRLDNQPLDAGGSLSEPSSTRPPSASDWRSRPRRPWVRDKSRRRQRIDSTSSDLDSQWVVLEGRAALGVEGAPQAQPANPRARDVRQYGDPRGAPARGPHASAPGRLKPAIGCAPTAASGIWYARPPSSRVPDSASSSVRKAAVLLAKAWLARGTSPSLR